MYQGVRKLCARMGSTCAILYYVQLSYRPARDVEGGMKRVRSITRSQWERERVGETIVVAYGGESESL